MDTRSKSIKHSFIFKSLCFVLSLVCVFSFSMYTLYAAGAVLFSGSFDVISGAEMPQLTQTSAFYEALTNDVYYMGTLAVSKSPDELREQLTAKRDETIELLTDKYLQKKASIIEAELYYVATHYDRDENNEYYYDDENEYVPTPTTAVYGNYTDAATVSDGAAPAAGQMAIMVTDDDTADTSAVRGEPDAQAETAAEKSGRIKIEVDPYAPSKVQQIQRIINKTSGLDYLKYEGLVREDAFTEQRFNEPLLGTPGMDGYCDFDAAYNYTETAIRQIIAENYDECVNYCVSQQRYERTHASNRLEKLYKIKYLVTDGQGKVLCTNLPAAEATPGYIKGKSVFFAAENGEYTQKGLDDIDDGSSFYGINSADNGLWGLVSSYTADKQANIYFCYEPEAKGDDTYSALAAAYERLNGRSIRSDAVAVLIFFALSIVFFVALCCLCGHKNGNEGTTLSFIDAVPTDIHLVLSVLLCIGVGAAVVVGFDNVYNNLYSIADMISSKLLWYALAGAATLIYAILCELILSFTRIKKARLSMVKRSFIFRFLRFVWRIVRKFFRRLRDFYRRQKNNFFYKPENLKTTAIRIFAAYVTVNFLLAVFAALFAAGGTGGISALLVIAMLVFNGLMLRKALKYIRLLDKIISAARRGETYTQSEPMPQSLKTLCDSLQVTNERLREAVGKAVRDERTKTELITNVSHDLKTPLTSVISYVDLLKKCDITDETAIGYIEILDEKSTKLKRLIEDLIEASKVSTGNVTLNKTSINLSELVVQAVGEMSEGFEENGLEVILSEPKTSPVVLADSQKTFRVIDNLFNNARKYSTPGSRVYVTLIDGEGYGEIVIKNISLEPLNISPEELTERFVRGDSARTDGGNGLGLSIAKELCSLQGGSLDIAIDGDLFKATVRLPKSGMVGSC